MQVAPGVLRTHKERVQCKKLKENQERREAQARIIDAETASITLEGVPLEVVAE